jgi:hypothetical protein
MRNEETPRVFDRANWRRKARVPTWIRSNETEKPAWVHREATPTKEW